MRVWLKGEKAGKAETFVDLPGAPDNIRLGSDGHFWIALHVSLPATGSRLLASSIPNLLTAGTVFFSPAEQAQHHLTVLSFWCPKCS